MDEFTELRNLLLQEEQTRLNKLDQRLDDPQQRSRETAEVLPQAIHLLAQKKPGPLHKALQEPIEHCVQTSLDTDPQRLAKPLLNAMSQPLRKVIADSFKSIREYVQANQEEIQQLDARVQPLEKNWQALLARLSEQEKTILTRLAEVESEFNDVDKRTADLARILPQAIRAASQAQMKRLEQHERKEEETKAVKQPFPFSEEELSEALKAPVEKSLRQSISEDPHSLANALFPIMGPAIRKSINESIKGLIENINRTVERSLSPQGMAWRLESLRTGRPFGEIVLQKTLVYRVDQVFLIHRESGLLMQHLHMDDTEVGDSDAVSAMLTAIQDFIRDSFSGAKNEELDSVDIGAYTVWLERGPYAVLACVIRGNAPYAFRQTMRALLELMHARHGRTLESFEGDTDSIKVCEPLLNKALQVEKVHSDKKKSSRFSAATVLGVLMLLGLGGWFIQQQWQNYRLEQRISAYLQTLAEEPGIIVTQVQLESDELFLRGLRDPLSTSPQAIAEQQALPLTVQTHWQAYQDMSPKFVEIRLHQQAERWLHAPDTVNVEWQGTKLILTGRADQQWIDRVLQDSPVLVGLSNLDSSQLLDNNAYWNRSQAQFEAFLKTLNTTPGIIVVSSGIEGEQRFINGMRDPLAVDPHTIAKQMGMQHVRMQWRNYQDLTPEFVRQRVVQYLSPVPDTVNYQIQENILKLSGYVSERWRDKAMRATSIAGINQIDVKALGSLDDLLLQRAQQALNPPRSIKLQVHKEVLSVSGTAQQNWIDQLSSAQIKGVESIDTDQLQSLDAVLLKRARTELKAYKQVQLEVKYQRLILSGQLSLPEIERITQIASKIEGIKAVDTQGLKDKNQKRRQVLRNTINNTEIFFADGSVLAKGQRYRLNRLAAQIRELEDLNAGLDVPLQVHITGYTDGLGSLAQNQTLARARSEHVQARLRANKVSTGMLRIMKPQQVLFGERQVNLKQRKVVFKVIPNN